jgi:hypothetical protein
MQQSEAGLVGAGELVQAVASCIDQAACKRQVVLLERLLDGDFLVCDCKSKGESMYLPAWHPSLVCSRGRRRARSLSGLSGRFDQRAPVGLIIRMHE